MKIISVLNPFWCFFYFCGFNSVYFKKHVNIQQFNIQIVLNYLPVILGIILNLILSIFLFSLVANDYGIVSYFLQYSTVLLMTCTLLLPLLQLLIHRRKLISIICQIELIELNLKNIYFSTLKRDYFLRVFWLYFAQVAKIACIYSLVKAFDGEFYALLMYSITQIMAQNVTAHTIFYVDICTVLLKNLSEVLKERLKFKIQIITEEELIKTNYNLIEIETLKTVKHLYLDIWQLSEEINSFYGWSVVLSILKDIYDIIVDAFWIFMSFRDGKDWWILTRNT